MGVVLVLWNEGKKSSSHTFFLVIVITVIFTNINIMMMMMLRLVVVVVVVVVMVMTNLSTQDWNKFLDRQVSILSLDNNYNFNS